MALSKLRDKKVAMYLLLHFYEYVIVERQLGHLYRKLLFLIAFRVFSAWGENMHAEVNLGTAVLHELCAGFLYCRLPHAVSF